MELDDEVCLCFHITKRKLINFLRIERPRRVAQMSDCFGAGTGCGWCRSYLKRLFEQDAAPTSAAASEAETEFAADDYARARAEYVRRGGGTPPPGATPVDSVE